MGVCGEERERERALGTMWDVGSAVGHERVRHGRKVRGRLNGLRACVATSAGVPMCVLGSSEPPLTDSLSHPPVGRV